MCQSSSSLGSFGTCRDTGMPRGWQETSLSKSHTSSTKCCRKGWGYQADFLKGKMDSHLLILLWAWKTSFSEVWKMSLAHSPSFQIWLVRYLCIKTMEIGNFALKPLLYWNVCFFYTGNLTAVWRSPNSQQSDSVRDIYGLNCVASWHIHLIFPHSLEISPAGVVIPSLYWEDQPPRSFSLPLISIFRALTFDKLVVLSLERTMQDFTGKKKKPAQFSGFGRGVIARQARRLESESPGPMERPGMTTLPCNPSVRRQRQAGSRNSLASYPI